MADLSQDPRYVFFTRLMWIWVNVCVVLITVFAFGEWLTPRVAASGLPSWAVTIWIYLVRYSFGFAAGFCMLALLMAQQRSMLKK